MHATPRKSWVAPSPAIALAYTAMIAMAVVGFLLIRARGVRLVAAESAPQGVDFTRVAATSNPLLHVLIALVVVIVTARLLGALFRHFHQPPVIGEVIAGILLGPSLLGRVAPNVAAFVLPVGIAPFLSVIAQIGVILYMFLVGLELNSGLVRRQTQTSVAVSHTSIVLPFLLGSLLSLLLYERFAPPDVAFTPFALFIGVSMSVTAFPVLARILTDRDMAKSRLGAIALACAAVDDVTAWCLLAFVVSIVQAQPERVLMTIGLTAGFIITMVVVVRRIALRFVAGYERRSQEDGRFTQGILAAVCVVVLVCALATESIGIHAFFGAFFLGAIIPHGSRLARDIASRIEDLVVVLFLPAFFAFTGMRTEIGLVQGLDQWLIVLLIILVASLGKFGGSTIAARFTGLDWRSSMGLGILMNTRGLMELIVLNVGLDLGVLSPTLFAMLVLMALVTTFATSPILHLLRVDHE